MNFAVIILNDDINSSIVGEKYATGMLPIHLKNSRRTILEIKIGHILWFDKTYGSQTPIIIVNRQETQESVYAYLSDNDFFRINDRLFTFPEETTRGMDPASGDFLDNLYSENSANSMPIGRFDALAGIIRTGIISYLLKRNTDYLVISDVTNLGATLDPKLIAMLKLLDQKAIVETVQAPGFPRAFKLKDGSKRLLEREEIPSSAFSSEAEILMFAPLAATSTYWIPVNGLLQALGLETSMLLKAWDEFIYTKLQIFIDREIGTVPLLDNVTGGVFHTRPLSKITSLMPTEYLEVQRDRYLTLSDIKLMDQKELDNLANFTVLNSI